MINVLYIEFWFLSMYYIDKKYNFLEVKFFFLNSFLLLFFCDGFYNGFFYLKKYMWVVFKWLNFLVCENLDI